MTVRSAFLFASAAAIAGATPALAQDGRYSTLAEETAQDAVQDAVQDPVQDAVQHIVQDSAQEDEWQGMWNGTYTDLEGHSIRANYRGTFTGETRFAGENGPVLLHDADIGWHEAGTSADYASYAAHRDSPASHTQRAHHGMHHTAGGRPLGYTVEQREDWLADCRALYLGDSGYLDARQDDDGGNGGILGSLLGAVTGGIIGNRVADGERLGGTLIGAGLGGLAGLAIGSAIDAVAREDREEEYDYDDREFAYAADYCEAYLRRYESGAYSNTYAYGMQAQPVMMVQVAAPHHPRQRYREVVREEWVDVPADAAPRPARPAPTRQAAPRRAVPQATKLTPVK